MARAAKHLFELPVSALSIYPSKNPKTEDRQQPIPVLAY
jgi:hypothetical protein